MSQVNKSLGFKAWKNLMPGAEPSLHVVGAIMAPTPSHEPKLIKTPDDPSKPALYKLKLQFFPSPFPTLQILVPKSVEYVETNYKGQHTEVEITLPGGAIELVPIESAQ